MLLGGVLGPDSLGPGHGEYLPQRLVLLGLVAMVPAFDIPLATRWGRLAAGCLAAAVGLQTVIVWDYALHCKHTAVQIIKASELVGRDQRIAPLLIGIRSRFRANPLLHADSWLGVGTGNILWSNYEARYYYFPVQFRPGLDRADPKDFERLSLSSDPVPRGNVRTVVGAGSLQARALDRPGRGLEERSLARCDHRAMVRPRGRAWRCSDLRAAWSGYVKRNSREALIGEEPWEDRSREQRKRRFAFNPTTAAGRKKVTGRWPLTFLLLLQLEEEHLVGHGLEVLGTVMAGH